MQELNTNDINELVEKYKADKERFAKPLFDFICRKNAIFISQVAQEYSFPLNYLRNFDINRILDKCIFKISKETIEEDIRLDLPTLILNEANEAKEKDKFSIALILYATWIEHWFNDLINILSVTKNLTDEETKTLVKSNFNIKLSYVLPIFDLPRLEDNIVKKINTINETRNNLVHYKWKPVPINNICEYFDKQASCVKSATDVVNYLMNYTKINILNDEYLYFILSSLVFVQTGIDMRT